MVYLAVGVLIFVRLFAYFDVQDAADKTYLSLIRLPQHNGVWSESCL